MSLVLLLFFSLVLLQSYTVFPNQIYKKGHIIYMGSHSHGVNEISSLTREKIMLEHLKMLESAMKNKENANNALIYSYTNVINGFAAIIDEEEAAQISKDPSVVSVFPLKDHKLHTTHSWNFLELERRNGMVSERSLWARASYGDGTIIGNIDSGVWPESESFKDDGMGPIPLRWKGACMNDSNLGPFPCNKKLIGAKYFHKGFEALFGSLDQTAKSPRDTDGHGTHTLSTAAGSFVANASVSGYGLGTSKGGSPKARVAAYKACWSTCTDADVLAAFDTAIYDGVDVLSVSLGSQSEDYASSGLAIGSFHAVSMGITVVCSAGNSGPFSGTVENTAPWIFTVGASIMDREFPSYLSYAPKKHIIKGQSMSAATLGRHKPYPIVSSVDLVASNASVHNATLCMPGSLDAVKAKDKIVVCILETGGRIAKGLVVHQAGGKGMILVNDVVNGDGVIADPHVLPATHISYTNGLKLFASLNSTRTSATYGHITKPKVKLGTKPAPVMASFSSKGPNPVVPEILKPDITAPGVSVIASWTRAQPRLSSFNSVSGTSMSCPHVAGVVGLLKTLHPDWSPAAIRSAIMTSATVIDNSGNVINNSSPTQQATPFSYGSGHIWPNRAMNPGLVYDITPTNYLHFLCALKFNASEIKNFSITPFACPSVPISIENLNYPSFSVPNLSGSITVTRTVKNVGGPSTYKAVVVQPNDVKVIVRPDILVFTKLGEEKKFNVTFIAKKGPKKYVFGALIWDDGKHTVRSPMAIKGKGY